MKIQQLFDELKIITNDKESVFEDSGMINCYNKMQYGFFPLGLGILTENNKIKDDPRTDEIEKGGVMVLGNDFGTVSYVKDVLKGSEEVGEIKSPTIKNFLKIVPKINTNKTFFTNFYLGVRLDNGVHEGTTMIKRMSDGKINKIKKEYWELCYRFFVKQLELVKPQKVICLGHYVKEALIMSGISFQNWEPQSDSLKKLYAKDGDMHIVNMELNGIKFIVIPHPCYPVNLLKPPYLEKLNAFLDSK
jgi:hypothetical protein